MLQRFTRLATESEWRCAALRQAYRELCDRETSGASLDLGEREALRLQLERCRERLQAAEETERCLSQSLLKVGLAAATHR